MNNKKRTMVKSISISGILILAILLTMSSTNQVFAKKDNRVSNEDNVGQDSSSNQAAHCKSSMKLSAQWYTPYRTLMMRGTLTCGDSGLAGKTIILTSSKLSYVGKIATAVTGPDGSFSTNYKTTKPITTVSAWYLGGPDEGGMASKVINLGPCPWCGTQQQSSNAGNTQQQPKNSVNTNNNNVGNTQGQSTNEGNTQQQPKNSVNTNNNNVGNTQGQNTNAGNTQQQPKNSVNTNTNNNNVGNTQGQSTDFINTILKIHNNERAAVSVTPLVWSNTLAADAKSWAEHLAKIGTLQHSTGNGYGENLSFRSDSRGPSAISTASLLQGWVNEKNGYSVHPFQWPGDKAQGHYTQMVWKTTTKIGCGIATSGNSVYLACQYTPQGNIQGKSPY